MPTESPHTREELHNKKLDLYISLFESGKELNARYQVYSGTMDWYEFVEDQVRRIPGFDEPLDKLIDAAIHDALERQIILVKTELFALDEANKTGEEIMKEVFSELENIHVNFPAILLTTHKEGTNV